MEAIAYGFLLGIGILLALLAFCVAIGLVSLFVMFVNYLVTKPQKAAPTSTDE